MNWICLRKQLLFSVSEKTRSDLQLFATKLTEKYLILVMQREYYNTYLKRKKLKISKTTKNNYSTTKNF